MSNKVLAKNTVWYISALATQKALSFLYFIIIARAIGVEDLGKFSFALSFTTIFAIVLDFGMTQVLIRESARDKQSAQKYLSSSLGIKLIGSAIIYLFVIFLINIMQYPTITKQLVYITGIVMIFDSLALSFYGILRGHHNLKFESLGAVANQTLVLLFGFLAVTMNWGLRIIMSAYLIGSLFNFTYSALWMYLKTKIKPILSYDIKIIKTLLIYSLPFAIAGIFMRLYSNIDIVLLSKMTNDTAVGLYGVAYKVSFALQFMGLAVLASVYPIFCSYFLSDKSMLETTYNKVLYFMLFLSLPLSVGVIAVSDKIIGPVFGQQYEASLPAIYFMMTAIPLSFMSYPSGALLNACNKQNINTAILGITALFSIMLNLILIPIFGFVGSAMAVPLSYALMLSSQVYFINKIIKFENKFLAIKFTKLFLSASVMFAFAWYAKQTLNVLPVILLSVVLYIASIYFIKAITKKDVLIVYDLIVKK